VPYVNILQLAIPVAIFALGIAVDRGVRSFKDARAARHIRFLLRQELMDNLQRLKDIDSELDSHPHKFTLEFAAARIEAVCRRDAFMQVQLDMRVIGMDAMTLAFRFYNQAASVPFMLRSIEEFDGNIRSTLLPDILADLDALGQAAVDGLAEHMN